jgi:hypothetical protein
MDASAGPAPLANAPAPEIAFGSGRLFLADSRMAFALLNYGRQRVVQRVFGVTPEQVNILSVVLALSVAQAAFEGTRRVAGAPLHVRGGDVALGGFTAREAVLSMVGPGSREIPFIGTLLAAAMIGGVALPGVRRAARSFRAAELRMRTERIRRYVAAAADEAILARK